MYAGAMTYIPSFIEIGACIEKSMARKHRQKGDDMSIL
jgi:hypothetical protein